jgi:hypothetical protein
MTDDAAQRTVLGTGNVLSTCRLVQVLLMIAHQTCRVQYHEITSTEYCTYLYSPYLLGSKIPIRSIEYLPVPGYMYEYLYRNMKTWTTDGRGRQTNAEDTCRLYHTKSHPSTAVCLDVAESQTPRKALETELEAA